MSILVVSQKQSFSTDPYHYFVEQMLAWYAENGRKNLPWRQPQRNAYQIWVSEVMLQQTQVNRVIDYYERFLQRFPDIKSLAQASWEEFLPYYQGLGYYQRGRNMLKTAQIVVAKYHGEFPKNFQQLLDLPGIGSYTAAAILSFAYDLPFLAFDTNQQRVWGRYLYGSKAEKVDQSEIQKKLPKNTNFAKLNAAIMDFANLVYKNRQPDLENSPLAPLCRFWQTGGSLEKNLSAAKSDFPTAQAQTLLILHRQHQEYYSSSADHYEAFLLAAPLNTRSAIKNYFQRRYHLELSVRPAYKRAFLEGKPTLFVRAQVLLGAIPFKAYPAGKSFQPEAPFQTRTN